MPSISSGRVPKLRLHKPSGRAVVRLNGRDYYLGRFGSPESQAEYDRLIGEWILAGRQTPAKKPGQPAEQMTIGELMVAYLLFADGYYRKNGEPTGEFDAIRYSLRPLRKLYCDVAAVDFGPLALKNVREQMIAAELCRKEVNKRVQRIVRMFRWGVENEFVPPMVHHALKQVTGLRFGRSNARETAPIGPVDEASVAAIKPYVSRQIWAMIRLQQLTGMRPGEVCQLRGCDIDRSALPWTYRPSSHKTQHHGHTRKVYLGPEARLLLTEWGFEQMTGFLFSPQDELTERSAARRKARKTSIQPSQTKRKRKPKPSRAPGERYNTAAYGHAIARACKRAGVQHWSPNQLRHSAATHMRQVGGLEATSLALGHKGLAVTEIYAERDEKTVAQLIEQIG
jgi:integrase